MAHDETQRRQSINDSWSRVLGTQGGQWLHIVINKILAAFIHKRASEKFHAPSWE